MVLRTSYEAPTDYMTRKVLDIETKTRGRGRPQITWMSVVNKNLKEAQVNKETTLGSIA